MPFDEFAWISTLPGGRAEGLVLGIGDDGALFDGPGPWCASTDSLVEGVHFLADDDPALVGRKSAAVNLSDMAAMGCRPRFFLLNLHLVPAWEGERLEGFRRGLLAALDAAGTVLIGGDTVFSPVGPFSVAGTILGTPYPGGPVRRAGARPGDRILVTGPGLGGSFPRRHLAIEPRLAWSEALCRQGPPTAMMDVSDGLLQDLGHILDKSGVAAELDLWRVPVHPDVAGPAEERLRHALSDGEDFELLFTFPQELALPDGVPCSEIGRVTAGRGTLTGRGGPGLPPEPLERLGYRHGR